MRPWAGALAAVLALSACTVRSAPPPAALTAGSSLAIQATPTPLVATRPTQLRVGAFVYAGGLHITSSTSSRLHGLSDLEVDAQGGLTAITDDGDVLEARVRLDRRGRLAGLDHATLKALTDENGRPLEPLGKAAADAEGLAVMSDGQRLVSFERDHRILRYTRTWTSASRAASPAASFSSNAGMEALAPNPAAGSQAYVVGAEDNGQTWDCQPAGCTASARVPMPEGFGLVALDVLPDGRRVYLLRAFSVLEGVRVILRIVGADGALIDELKLASPLTVDNYEGLAAVPRADGTIRFYLLSDDNFSKLQRTLLVAFDWQPHQGRVQ